MKTYNFKYCASRAFSVKWRPISSSSVYHYIIYQLIGFRMNVAFSYISNKSRLGNRIRRYPFSEIVAARHGIKPRTSCSQGKHGLEKFRTVHNQSLVTKIQSTQCFRLSPWINKYFIYPMIQVFPARPSSFDLIFITKSLEGRSESSVIQKCSDRKLVSLDR